MILKTQQEVDEELNALRDRVNEMNARVEALRNTAATDLFTAYMMTLDDAAGENIQTQAVATAIALTSTVCYAIAAGIAGAQAAAEIDALARERMI